MAKGAAQRQGNDVAKGATVVNVKLSPVTYISGYMGIDVSREFLVYYVCYSRGTTPYSGKEKGRRIFFDDRVQAKLFMICNYISAV